MVHSTCGQACRWQVKLCNPSLTRAIIPEDRHEFLTIKYYTSLRTVTLLLYFIQPAVVPLPLSFKKTVKMHLTHKRVVRLPTMTNNRHVDFAVSELTNRRVGIWRQAVYDTSHLRSSSKLSLAFVAGHGSEAVKKMLKFLSPYLNERATDRTDFLPLC